MKESFDRGFLHIYQNVPQKAAKDERGKCQKIRHLFHPIFMAPPLAQTHPKNLHLFIFTFFLSPFNMNGQMKIIKESQGVTVDSTLACYNSLQGSNPKVAALLYISWPLGH